MSELHSMSMAFTTSSLHNSSLGWDCHNNHLLGFFNTDRMSFAMDDQYMMNEPYPSPPLEHSDFSTGYLEDALIEFSERSKRRRLHEQWEVSENFDCMSQLTSSSALSGLLGDPLSAITTPMNTSDPDQAAVDSSSSSSSYKETLKIRATSGTSIGDDKSSTTKKRRPAVVTRVVTPFAVVKPGGGEGEVTLNDINERILMPPTRPVRHPVGNFACRPCVSADGPGLSGKAVVALTRIHTQGRGTITIIRTKG